MRNNDGLSDNFIKRFWEKINIDNNTGCWNWSAYKNKDGYGVCHITINGRQKMMLAHRLSYLLTYHVLIDGENRCLHICDNPSCINPSHLFVGTQKDNIVDMYQKNRQSKSIGSGVANSKLTEEEVKEIKSLLKNGESPAIISKRFNVSRENIYLIKNEETWRHVQI